MNGDHGDALLAYAKGLLLVPEASAVTMTAVDRYGFDLAIDTPKGPKAARLAFDQRLAATDEVRKAIQSDELKAIWAYLRSLAPVKNRVPQPIDPPETQR